MDDLELELWDQACAARDAIDVGAAHDHRIEDAIHTLAARGYVKIEMGGLIIATDAGRAANKDYHAALKQASKREAQAREAQRKQEQKSVLAKLAGVILRFFTK